MEQAARWQLGAWWEPWQVLEVSERCEIRPRGSVVTCFAARLAALPLVLVAGGLVLAATALAAPALATREPDPYRADTAVPEPVAPDPYPAGNSAPKPLSAPAPDSSAGFSVSQTTPSVSTSGTVEPNLPASTPKKNPSRSKGPVSNRGPKTGSTGPAQTYPRDTGPTALAVETRTKPNAVTAVGVLAASTSGRPLASGGLALLALALASGSLLLLLGSQTWRQKA